MENIRVNRADAPFPGAIAQALDRLYRIMHEGPSSRKLAVRGCQIVASLSILEEKGKLTYASAYAVAGEPAGWILPDDPLCRCSTCGKIADTACITLGDGDNDPRMCAACLQTALNAMGHKTEEPKLEISSSVAKIDIGSLPLTGTERRGRIREEWMKDD